MDEGGGGNDWVTVSRAPNDIEAHLMIGRLTEAGIETLALKDRSRTVGWLHGGSDPWGPVLVMVRALRFEDARIVLAEVAFDAPAATEHAASPGGWRGPVVWWALAIGLGVLLSVLSYVGTKEASERCHREGTCLIAPDEETGDPDP